MQIDMHYGAIYYLACCAGIDAAEAEKIAWSSQFVDDAEFGGTVQFPDGEGCFCSNSAHQHVTDNLTAHGRLVWIPYHFVPDSTTQGSFLDRLKCTKDSDLAKDAVQAAIDESDIAIRPYRFGVALHAYADTWAHYGFSGFWSDANLVDHVEPINVEQHLWDSFKILVGTLYANLEGEHESAIGHLLVDVCPDLPYLEWRYRTTAESTPVHRNNPADFKEALKAMGRFMLRYQSPAENPRTARMNWEVLDKLIRQPVDAQARLSGWSDAIHGEFGGYLPEYKEKRWLDDALGKEWKRDKCIITDVPYSSFIESDYWRFCVALRKHSELIVSSLGRAGLNIV